MKEITLLQIYRYTQAQAFLSHLEVKQMSDVAPVIEPKAEFRYIRIYSTWYKWGLCISFFSEHNFNYYKDHGCMLNFLNQKSCPKYKTYNQEMSGPPAVHNDVTSHIVWSIQLDFMSAHTLTRAKINNSLSKEMLSMLKVKRSKQR